MAIGSIIDVERFCEQWSSCDVDDPCSYADLVLGIQLGMSAAFTRQNTVDGENEPLCTKGGCFGLEGV